MAVIIIFKKPFLKFKSILKKENLDKIVCEIYS